MSINCRNGGVLHEHETVQEVRECHGMRPDAPIKNVVPQGPKPGDPNKAKRIEAARNEEARNTALARAGQPHGFTSDCPQCVGIGAGHAVASQEFADADPMIRMDDNVYDDEPEGVYRAKMERDREWVAEDEEFANALKHASESLQFQTSQSERTAFLNAESAERPRRNGFGTPRPNRYGGTCVECDQYVKKEEGILLGNRTVGYSVRHKEGECPPPDPGRQSADGDPEGYGDPQPEQNRWKRDEAKQAAKPERGPLPDVSEGHYAIESLTGNNDLDFFRVDRPERDGRKRTFIKRVIGGKPSKNIHRSQYLDVLNAILKAGEQESARLYGQEIGRCSRCNRHLTDEVSRRYGMGPECRSKAS